MAASARKFSPSYRRLICAALLAGVATASPAYKPDSDAKAAYDRAMHFVRLWITDPRA